MAKIFITGSADGLGHLSAKALADQGHEVVLHARNEARAQNAIQKIPNAHSVLTADLSNFDETKALAEGLNRLGSFDAIIHNAGVYQVPSRQIFNVNLAAPYILTCLIQKPKRLIYLSSEMHMQGKPNLPYFKENNERLTYSDSKLHIIMLALAVSRHWQDVYANSVNPGWVPTRMGGKGAPGNLQKGYETQSWLAVSDEDAAMVRGRYFFHKKQQSYNTLADDIPSQERMLELLHEITGVVFPR